MTYLTEIPKQKPAAILDGLEVSEVILNDVRKVIEAHVKAGGQRPGLAVIPAKAGTLQH